MENEWQPIETAPISAELILLFDETRRKCYGEIFTGYRVMANKGMDNEKPMTMDDGCYDFRKATHWMPCPKPPTK